MAAQKQTAEEAGRDALWDLFHKQGDKIESTTTLLAETRADVKGLASHLERFMTDYKTGQASMMTAIENMHKPRPNQLWQIVGVCLVILTMFGSVVVYMVKSESEKATAGIHAVAKAQDSQASNTKEQFAAFTQTVIDLNGRSNARWDRLAEKHIADSYKMGLRDADIEHNTEQFRHHDEQQHLTDAVLDQFKSDTLKAQAINETGLRATGDYAKEHAAKEGGAGHPIPERIITAPYKLAVDNQ